MSEVSSQSATSYDQPVKDVKNPIKFMHLSSVFYSCCEDNELQSYMEIRYGYLALVGH